MNARQLCARVLFGIALSFSIWSPVSARDRWLAVRTKNFEVVGNASEEDVRQVGLKLEQFRAIFMKLFKLRDDSPVPITVLVFKSSDAFKPYKPLYNGKPANVAGYFQRGDDKNIIALELGANDERPLGIILHEYTHLLTAYSTRSWPIWLQEGIAELYSTFDVKKNTVTIGIPVSSHVYRLRESKFIPMDKLMQVAHDSPDYNERDKQGIFYAESWALAHYLMFGNKSARQPELVKFIQLYTSGATAQNAFTEAFKTDFATMEKELHKYVGNSNYNGITFTLDSVEGEKEAVSRTLPDAEVQFYLGDLLLHINRVDDAEGLFKQAATLDPKLAGGYEGLGFVAMRRNKYAEARELFKKAVDLGSQNHLAHYYYAESIEREFVTGRSTMDSVDSEAAKLIVSELKKTIKLMPGFVPAYNLLAFMSLVGAEPLPQGVEALKIALKIEPQNAHCALTLAQLQMRMQDFESAKKTLKPLLAADTDPSIRGAAESLTRSLESYQNNLTRDQTEDVNSHAIEPDRTDRNAPHLKRRESQTDPPRETDQNPDAPPSNTKSIRGVLAAIECRDGMALLLKTDEGMKRFIVSDPMKLNFYSRDPNFNVSIGCGPINAPAIVQFKDAPQGKSGVAGDAMSVEFIKAP